MSVVIDNQLQANLARWAELRAQGGSPVDLTALQKVLDDMVDCYQPSRLYLFGSLASGNFDEDSDVDLMLVVPDDATGERRQREIVNRLRTQASAPLDIVLTSDSRFDGQCNWVNGLASEVFRTGKLLHSRAAETNEEETSIMVPEDFTEQSHSWLKSASGNLRTGEAALALDPPEPVTALGLAEQCCERCCKALLAAAGQKVPHTHELPKLQRELAAAGLASPLEQVDGAFISGLQELHRYGAENLELAELPLEDAQRAITIARACFDATTAALQ